MTMSDPIADMLTRIRNANTAKHDTGEVPAFVWQAESNLMNASRQAQHEFSAKAVRRNLMKPSENDG